jgi:hypothetical protein
VSACQRGRQYAKAYSICATSSCMAFSANHRFWENCEDAHGGLSCRLTFELSGPLRCCAPDSRRKMGRKPLRLVASVTCRWRSPLTEGLGLVRRETGGML